MAAGKKTKVSIIIESVWKGKGTKDAKDEMSGLSKSVTKLGKVASGAVVAAGTAVTAFAVKSLASFNDFEKGMKEVFTLLPDLSDKATKQMEKDLLAFSKSTGRLTKETIPALYQSISAGVPADNVFSFLETANQAALGGATDLETAVDGLTSVVNAYGSEVITAGEASDLMFTAVKGGKTTMEELSRSLFQVLPIASSLKIPFGEITAASAALTATGVPTSIAMTQIRSALNELGKDGSKAADNFERLAGKSFREFIAQGGTVQEAFNLMKVGADDSGEAVNNMFSRIEAGNAVLTLAGAGAEKYAQELDAAANAAGATEEAADKMGETMALKIDKAKSSAEAFSILLGEKLAPAVIPALDAIIEKFGEIDEAMNAPEAEGFWKNLASGAKGFFGTYRREVEAQLAQRAEDSQSLADYIDLLGDMRDVSTEIAALDRFELGGAKGIEEGAFKQIREGMAGTVSSIEEYRLAVEEARQAGSDLFPMEDYANAGERMDAIIGTYNEFSAASQLVEKYTRAASRGTGDYTQAAEGASGATRQLEQDQIAAAEAAKAQAEAIAKTAEDMRKFFVASLDLVNQPVSLADFMFEAAKNSNLAAEDLKYFAEQTDSINSQQADQAFLLAEIQTRTAELTSEIQAGNLTREQATAILQEEYGAQIDQINATVEATMSEEELAAAKEGSLSISEKAAELARQEAEARREQAAAMGDLFMSQLNSNSMAESTESILLRTADAAGANIGVLALLAAGTDEYTEAEVRNALASAALEERARLLGESLAAGTIGIDEAVANLNNFRDALTEEYAINVDTTSIDEAVSTTETLLGIGEQDVTITTTADLAGLEELQALTGDFGGEGGGGLVLDVDDSSIATTIELTGEMQTTLYEATDPIYEAEVVTTADAAISEVSEIQKAAEALENRTFKVHFAAEYDGSAVPGGGSGGSGGGSDAVDDAYTEAGAY